MRIFRVVLISSWMLALAAGRAESGAPAAEKPLAIARLSRAAPVDFASEILPIIRDNCLACHNQTKSKASLVLETPQTILKGGESGPAIVPGKSGESLLLKAAAHIGDTRMPPRDNKVKAANLTPEQLGLIALWIDQGAKGEAPREQPVRWEGVPSRFHPIYALAVSPDGRWAACGQANRIFLYDLEEGRLVSELTDPALNGAAQRDFVNALEFSPDGDWLASGGYRCVKLWRKQQPSFAGEWADASGEALSVSALIPGRSWSVVGTPAGRLIDWDWRRGDQQLVWPAHAAAVTAVAGSPDAERLASAGQDQWIRIWREGSSELLAEAHLASPAQTAVWISRFRLAAGDAVGKIMVWEFLSTPPRLVLEKDWRAHSAAITALARDESGGRFLSGSADGAVKCWSADGALVRSFDQGSPISALAWRPDGRAFAAAGADGRIKLWDFQTGRMLAVFGGGQSAQEEMQRRKRELGFAERELKYFSRSEKLLAEELKKQRDFSANAAQAADRARKEFSEKQRALDQARSAQREAKEALDEFRAADRSAAGAKTKTAAALAEARRRWRTAKGRTAAEADVLIDLIAKRAFEAGQAQAEFERFKNAAQREKNLAGQEKAARQKAAQLEPEFGKAQTAKLNAENDAALGKRLAVQAQADLDNARASIARMKRFKGESEARLKQAETAASARVPLRALLFSRDQQRLISAGADGKIQFWSAATGAPLQEFSASFSAILNVAESPDGFLITGDASGRARVWRAASGFVLARSLGSETGPSPLLGRVNAVAFSPDGHWLAAGSGEPSRAGQIMAWSLPNFQPIRDLKQIHSDMALALAFSPGGNRLASGAADKFVKVCDLAAGKAVRTFEGHLHHVLGVAWDEGGRVLASAGADGTIRFWDIKKGAPQRTIPGRGEEITSIHFIPERSQWFSTSGDGTARVWSSDAKEIRQLAAAGDYLEAGAVSPDGEIGIAGGQLGRIWAWRLGSGKAIPFENPITVVKGDLAQRSEPR